jgi:hypothetical protein
VLRTSRADLIVADICGSVLGRGENAESPRRQRAEDAEAQQLATRENMQMESITATRDSYEVQKS